MTTTPLTQPGTLTARVAEEIRSVMGRRKVTGAQLAKRLGVSSAWVSYRINGSVSTSMDDLERIAAALNVEVGDLLPQNLAATRSTGRYDSDQDPCPVDVISGYHNDVVRRPPDRRPVGRPVMGRPPAGPGRTSRVSRSRAA